MWRRILDKLGHLKQPPHAMLRATTSAARTARAVLNAIAGDHPASWSARSADGARRQSARPIAENACMRASEPNMSLSAIRVE